jgi:DNA-binding transcriptional regulator GbsR (MarR family)
MTAPALSEPMRRFVEYFGELGPRWGLDAGACKVHACLYLLARPMPSRDLAIALGLDAVRVDSALRYLAEWRMAEPVAGNLWRTGGDPWAMLFAGLEERRQREIGPAIETLRTCHADALAHGAGHRTVTTRIGAVLELVEDLAALDAQARRFGPQMLRRAVGIGGRAARFIDRTLSGSARGRQK